jgi:hypothetical protein
MTLPRFADSAERIVYRVGGLPVAISSSAAGGADPLRSAFVRRYWHPEGAEEWSELLGSLVIWPIGVLLAALWFTGRNGVVVRRRYGKSMFAQLREQLKLYFSAGVLPPWYYIFSLHDDGAARAATFIQRFETKTCYFRLLKRRKGSPLNDKNRFAGRCAEHGLRCAETLMSLEGSDPARPLPDQDLFVKPSRGRGGRGAERWDRTGPGAFRSPGGEHLSADDLLRRLVARSRREPLIVQARLRAHPDLLKLTAGALPTVRVLTCLNTKHEPEVMAAVVRTSFGKNTTVDNLHAGGIGALVDLKTGKLSKASNLGSDARLGWFSAHPDTGAAIEGSVVPCWDAVKALAIDAHRQFADRVVIGWDIAVLEDGPILIEGNGNPDLDILQRFMRIGLREHRFAQLLAHHMQRREPVAAAPVSR